MIVIAVRYLHVLRVAGILQLVGLWLNFLNVQAAVGSGLERMSFVGGNHVFLLLLKRLAGSRLLVEGLSCNSFEAAWRAGAFGL